MSDKFIKITKDGQTIEVHPSVVDDHKKLGWAVVGEEAAEPEPSEAEAAETEESPKKRKAKS